MRDDNVPVITEPETVMPGADLEAHHIPLPDVLTISRRDGNFGCDVPTLAVVQEVVQDHHQPRQVHLLQQLWQEHVNAIMSSSTVDMWRVFCSVRRQTRVCQSAVLRAVRPVLNHEDKKRWPLDRRQLDVLVAKAGGFNSRVIRTVKIEIKGGPVEFVFLDPVYAWCSTAFGCSREMPLLFRYVARVDPATNQRMFGTSVQCGEIMRKACERVNSRLFCVFLLTISLLCLRSPAPVCDCRARVNENPRGPALFGISWDGGQCSKRRSYTPIIISVANTDSSSTVTCRCIGYMPTLSQDADSDVRRELVQRCIGAIISVINACAKTGFTCNLHDFNNARCV